MIDRLLALNGAARMRARLFLIHRMNNHQWELAAEGRSFAFAGTLGADGAAVQLDQMFDDGKTETQPTVLARSGCVGLSKTLEEMRQKIGFDSLAVVDDTH